MTDDEIKTLMTRAQNSDGSATTGAFLWWICSAGALLIFPWVGPLSLAISGVLAIFGIVFSAVGRQSDVRWRHDVALRSWRFVCEDDPRFQPDSPQTTRLKAQITQIYLDDPRGDSFPFAQALRLLEVAFSIQSRLERIMTHIHNLEDQWGQLAARLERLRALGEDNPQGEAQLARLRRDLEALRLGTDELNNSCLRLEKVLASVTERTEVKRLQREIGQLSNTSTAPLPDTDVSDFHDLERQIAREIETFLQLERETDAHLNEM